MEIVHALVVIVAAQTMTRIDAENPEGTRFFGW